MNKTFLGKIKKEQILFFIVLIIGTVARFWVAKRGHNFDFDSYKIVAGITDHGQNVYKETTRYNYGPIWFNLLHLFSVIAHHFHDYWLVFRAQIIGILTAADIGISLVLLKRFGYLAAILFYLNPLSIAITGYHNQFDNLAILFALLAAILLERAETNKKDNWSLAGGILLLGISLTTKHLFFIFPLWLAWRQKGLLRKAAVLVLPVFLFLASFLPYISGGLHGIIHNVFLYKSFANAPFYYFVLPSFVQSFLTPMVVFIGGLILMGYLTRRLPLFRASLWYLVGLVMFSSAIANQYLVIVMPAIAAFASWLFLPYVVTAAALLWATSREGLHSSRLAHAMPQFFQNMVREDALHREYNWIIALLFLGAITYAYKNKIIKWLTKIYKTLIGELRKQADSLRT